MISKINKMAKKQESHGIELAWIVLISSIIILSILFWISKLNG